MTRKVLLVSIAAFSIFVQQCSTAEDTRVSEKRAEPETQHSQAPKEDMQQEIRNESHSTILFFMNPHGRPCQIQDEILQKMDNEFGENVSLTYVKTTNGSDRREFVKYGIRALPSLLIVDENGDEIKRFPPGIQDAATISNAFKEKGK